MIDFERGVRLGPINTDHLERLRLWRNDSRINEWCRQNDLISDYKQKKWFVSQANSDKIRMFMVYSDVGWKIGVAGLTDIDWVNRRAEFSLYIDPEKCGQGFGKKALETLFDYGFKTLDLKLIWGETFEDNPARSLFCKIGMRQDGIRRAFYYKNGRHINAILYSVTKEEWTNRDHFNIPDKPFEPISCCEYPISD